MSAVFDSRYDVLPQSLALGIEPIDAAREQPMLSPVMLTHDDLPALLKPGNSRPLFQRHASNRQVLLYDAYDAAQPRTLDLRLFDQTEALYAPDSDRRRFVPRRLRIALPSLADANLAAPAARACRPWLWPGSTYPVSDAVTGLRAHVMRSAAAPLPLRPARWARVLATVPATQPDLGSSTIVGRAMCDARGEFLLLIRHDPAAIGITSTLPVRLRVFAAAEALPASIALPAIDPLWDLPLEAPALLSDSDPVLRGDAMPPGHIERINRVVDLPLGRLLRGQPSLQL